MATDKLINQTQGADIIDALSDIATNVGNITYGPQTSADKVVSMTGYAKASAEAAISEGDTLNQAIGKLEKKADDNATSVAGKIDKLTTATAGDIATVTATGEIADSAVAIETTLSDSSDAKVPTSKAIGTYVDGKGYAVGVNSSTANNLVAFNDANGKALKDSGIAVAKSSTGLADSDTAVPTSKTVKTYVDSTATGISRYLGTITAASGLSTSAKKGDFYVVKTAWSGVHAGDEIIAEKDNPAQTIDGTNWSLLHNEADTDTKYTFATGDNNGTFKVTPSDTGTAQSVAIKGLGNAAYKGVADTVSTSTDLVTSAAVNTKLASYVPNSDFVVATNNIKYAINTGAKNFVNLFDTISSRSCTATELENGGMRLACTNAVWTQYFVNINLKPNTQYVLYTNMANFSGTSIGAISIRVQYKDEHGNLVQYKPTQTGEHTSTFTTESTTDLKLSVLINDSDTARTQSIDIWVMICEKVIYDTDPSYVSASLPNYDLTQLEAEDKAALAEVVDSGAKNVYQVPSTIDNDAGLTITTNPSTGTITVSGTATKDRYIQISGNLNLYGTYIVQGCPSTGSSSTYYLHLEQSNEVGANDVGDKNYAGSTNTYNSASCKLYIRIFNGVAFGNGVTFTPIVCTKAAFAVSPKFVPYRLPLSDNTWVKSADLFPSHRTEFDVSNSHVYTYTNKFLNKVVVSIELKAATDISSSTGVLSIASNIANIPPKPVFYDINDITNNFECVILKNNANGSLVFKVTTGTISSGTAFSMQIEYTYGLN